MQRLSSRLSFVVLSSLFALTACSGGGASSAIPSVSNASVASNASGAPFSSAVADAPVLSSASGSTATASAGSLTTFSSAHASLPALSLIPNIAGATNPTYAQVVRSDNPVAYYRLSDSGSALADSSANGLDGSYGPTVQHGQKIVGGSASASAGFNGGAYDTSEMALVAANPKLEPASTVTAEAWVSPSNVNRSNNYVAIVSFGREGNGQPYVLHLTPQNCPEIWLHTAAGGVKATGAALVVGSSYHVVGTFDGSTAKIYVNGVLEGSTTVAPTKLVYNNNGGLSIGGAVASTRPMFSGDVSDVAIYPTALSQATILSHYTAGVYTPMTTETPRSADAFVDSIGVNTHIIDSASNYYNQYAAFRSLLLGAGIRHVREGMANTTGKFFAQRVNDLAANGVTFNMVVDSTLSDATITSYATSTPHALESLEGPNEPDVSGVGSATSPTVAVSGTNWVVPTRVAMQRLHSLAKATPGLSTLPILAPALTGPGSAALLGNLGSLVDYGNMHDYFGGYNPGTTGWGSISNFGTYGSIAYNMNGASQVSGANPIIATETGYGTLGPVAPGNVPSDVLGKYVPRVFFEHFNNNVKRTFIYEFLDQNNTGATFTNYGLVSTSMQPKPSYNAIKAIIGALGDRGASFSPKPLTYTVTGNVANVHHTLLQKHDGSYYLALWIEQSDWNVNGHSAIAVPNQNVTIMTKNPISSALQISLDASGNAGQTPLPVLSGNSVNVTVGDAISLIRIK